MTIDDGSQAFGHPGITPHWTLDEWQTVHASESIDSEIGIYYVDIPISRAQKPPVRFTFFWINDQRWEGRDYEVRVM
jgi:glucoamylase